MSGHTPDGKEGQPPPKADPMDGRATSDPGRLEIICGCMFSGKTTELLRRLEEALRQGLRVLACKHAVDTRYSDDDIVTHDGRRHEGCRVATPRDLLMAADHAQVIAIDDFHFFDGELAEVCQELVRRGKRVIAAGLDRDAWGKPFPLTEKLTELADEVHRRRGVCARCGRPAEFTQRLTPICGSMVGGIGDYEPRCRLCFVPLPASVGSPRAASSRGLPDRDTDATLGRPNRS